jgi:hypothetical protein
MAIPEAIPIPMALAIAFMVFSMNFAVTLGAVLLGFKITLTRLHSKIDNIAEDVAEHKTTLYGGSLNDGLRYHVQDHGGRIVNIERHVFKGGR